MAVLFNRVLPTEGLAKWLVILLVLCCVKVHAETLRTRLLKKTVTTARCTANCYTLYGDRNNASGNSCQTTACKECLFPCGKTFGNETLCLNSCNTSISCGASCRFLTHLKNFSSILAGDGSISPAPGIPTVTNTTFGSIMLEWDPVRLNTSGTPVYIIGMSHKGDKDAKLFFSKHAFTAPRGTLTTNELCSFVPQDGIDQSFRGRSSFEGIYYKFKIAVATDNSSVSYGAETIRNITLPMPKPVSNITVTSIIYKSDQPSFRKLKLTATWSPPAGDVHVVSNYAMVWTAAVECHEFSLLLPRITITSGPETSGSIFFDEGIKKCNLMFTVYALNSCIPSNGTAITFEYPGCLNTTNYPKELCLRIDPPYALAEDRQVRNIYHRPASINDDYTFNMNVTWSAPLYPYKGILWYTVFWERFYPDLELFEFFSAVDTQGTSLVVGPLRPKEVYLIRILPFFVDFTPEGFSKNISIRTPGVDPAQVTVRNLKLEQFTFSPQTGAFELNVTWQKPVFNYSNITAYEISYQVNEGNVTSTNTEKTYFPFFGILHGQPISVNVTPAYAHDWISGTKHTGKGNAPAPDPGQLTVRNFLLTNFIISPQTGKYDLNVTWDKPSFNYSEISTYSLKFRVDRRDEVTSQTNKTYFIINDISHGETVIFKITPNYNHRWIIGTENQGRAKAPVPEDEKIKVRNLKAGTFVEGKDSNTFAVNFTWDPPIFQYRVVLYYNLSYVFSGYLRDQFPCPNELIKEHGCKITGIKDTSYQIPGIFPREHISIAVVPVYNDEYIAGKRAEADDNAPAPRAELLTVVGMKHDEIVPSSNNSFRTIVRWKQPLFRHSAVSYYRYKVTKKNEGLVQRRAIDFLTTKNTNVSIDGILLNEELVFQVTPEFTVDIVMGIDAKLSILKPEPSKHKSLESLTPGEISGLVVGLILLILIVICLMIWHRKRKTNWPEVLIDHWEVDGNLVSLEEEIGEGAFGKVYKGTLKELTTNAQKPFLKSSLKTTRSINGSEMFTVAVKMLHNIPDSEQRREFLEEIQLMKAVGSHKNIVNMVGCCTVEEPMFLLTEYVPYGDLLHYLRKRRGKVKENLGDDSRGPFRSTYCETYFTNDNSTGISVKATKSDRIYVNAPGMPREENNDIQIMSFSTTKPEDQVQNGEFNASLDMEEEESEENEEVLTPGDLLAFAWQITKAMEYLAKKGFVHRDLAARNVLVGENKIAKVADFGLTRHVYEGNAYCAKRNRKLPLKWMSIEAIFDQTFTSQSDVWAFGVVLWELVTLGGTPYPTIDNKELLRLLKAGYRMEKPDTCNEELYKMMTDCWKATPENRPTFTQIRESLETIMQKDNPYLDLTAVDETCAYYNVPSFNSITEESSDDSFESERDNAQKEESSKYLEFAVEEPNGNVALKEPQILDQSTDIDNKTKNGLSEKNSYGVNIVQDPKDVRINFNELEKRIYRPARRGFAF